MKKILNNRVKNKHKGFTLVELIVVLVILAILAAILVPTLLGYIQQARSKKDLRNAKALMDATQAAFVELYSVNGDVQAGQQLVPNDKSVLTSGQNKGKSNPNGDQDLSGTVFADEILKLVDFPKDKNGKYDKPYIFMVAAGSNATGTRMSQYDKFTLYYAMYMETKNSKPWYYYNGEWTTVNPTNKQMLFDKSDLNRVKDGPLKGKQLQYYVIVNKPNWSLMSGTYWNEIKKISD